VTLSALNEQHVLLVADENDGHPVDEPVHVVPVRGNVYRVLFTPGLVYDIAADDEIELLGDGRFKVVLRGQNLAVRVFSQLPIAEWSGLLEREVGSLCGRLDGQVEQGLAFTIPVRAGFKAVEAVFNRFIEAHPGCTWEYGNVYDEDDRPLGWWSS